MTESEAIKILKKDSCYECSQGTDSPLNCEYGECRVSKATRVAIQALEKQIPKKPDCIEDKIWCCPVCYNNLLHKWIKYPTMLMPKSEGLPHCMSCGQAIDWSDEE